MSPKLKDGMKKSRAIALAIFALESFHESSRESIEGCTCEVAEAHRTFQEVDQRAQAE